MSDVVVERARNAPIAILRLNRPAKLNALSQALLEELLVAARAIGADSSFRGVVLVGEGRSFCAGADIHEFTDWDPARLSAYMDLGRVAFRALEEIPQPVVAAIHGYALGGGCELAIACDLRVATASARFGYPEVTIGGVPGWGATARLHLIVGMGQAKKLLMTGEQIDAPEAQRIGLVEEVVPAESALPRALEIARQMARFDPTALGFIKQALGDHIARSVALQQSIEHYANLRCMLTPARRERVHSFVRGHAARGQAG